MAGGDGFVAVHVTTDPVEGELIVEVLGDHEIEARLEQVNGALMGAGQQIFQTRVEVPEADAVRARQLLEDLGDLRDLEQFSEPADAPAEAGQAELQRRGRLGAGIGLILPGAGHFRARWPWTTGVLVLGILTGLVLVKLLESNFGADLVFVALFTVPVCDALGARRLMRRDAKPGGRAHQIARGLALLSLASLVGTTVAGATSLPDWLRVRRQRHGLDIACGPRDLVVRNVTDGELVLSLDQVGVADGDKLYEAAATGPSTATLAPGEEVQFEFAVPERFFQRCSAPPKGPREDCWLVASLSSSRAPDEPEVESWAHCTPDWAAGARTRATIMSPEETLERFGTYFEPRR